MTEHTKKNLITELKDNIMPFFIPLAIGVAVVGVAAAGAVVKKRADKKKQRRKNVAPKPAPQEQPHYGDVHGRPAQRQQWQADKEKRQRENLISEPSDVRATPTKATPSRTTQPSPDQLSKNPEENQRPQRQDEYHLIAEHLSNGMVKTRCGKSMDEAIVHGPGHLPCSQCYRSSNRTSKR